MCRVAAGETKETSMVVAKRVVVGSWRCGRGMMCIGRSVNCYRGFTEKSEPRFVSGTMIGH